ncbi:hypothetical protein [Streptomyces sp. NPDC048057]|uniref:hypothetical protein n=1 Tax=Streptomyces sp. NPDC048057 TaxID=3155628 RepID=UPI0033EBD5ED
MSSDHIYVRGEGGTIFRMDLPLPEPIADRLAKGALRRVNEDGTPYVEPAEASGVPGLPLTEPARTAPKTSWVGWAVVQGATADDAEAMTKGDLIDKYGTGGGSGAGDQ